MTVYQISTPISEEETRKFIVRDVIYLSGTIFTARDEAHRRALELASKGMTLPIKVDGLAMYHCGPIVRKVDEKWRIISAGPTTSSRMEMFESDFLRNFKVSMIIGKGGMGPNTTEAMKKHVTVYGTFTGGAGALAAESIIDIEGVEWLDLGIPEALWSFKIKNFGPIIITIDSYGNNLHQSLMKKVEKRIDQMKKKL